MLVLAACGAPAEPTLSAPDVANTAMAVAWTDIARTQAAIPTATALPPTLTPAPVPTLFPTLPPLPTAGPPATATPDLCNQPPPTEPRGATVQVNFKNKSGGNLNLGFGMQRANSLGECGTYNFSLGQFESPTVRVLAGCYWGYAWISGDKPSTAQTINNLCVEDPGVVYAVTIGTEVIEFK
jgi:hypothetical protein